MTGTLRLPALALFTGALMAAFGPTEQGGKGWTGVSQPFTSRPARCLRFHVILRRY